MSDLQAVEPYNPDLGSREEYESAILASVTVPTVDAEIVDSEDEFWMDAAPAMDTYGVDLPGRPRGRYIYPDPPGYVRNKGAKPGFMRMTNLAGAFSDQKRLQLWRERMILTGLQADEGLLFDELAAEPLERMDPDKARSWMEAFANRCADRSGAGVGARRGTARHLMVQNWLEEGTIVGHRRMRLQLYSLMEALERHGLEPISGWSERRVCNPNYHVIGTLDMRVRDVKTGQEGILDLKTQRSFWSYLEIAGQQHGYDSAPWAWEGPNNDAGRWVPAPANNLTGLMPENEGKRVALLAHMPQEPGPGQLPVEIHEVSLEFGRQVLDLALQNIALRSIGGSKAGGRRIGGIRPLR
jgi:hypothetical protein